MTPAWTVLYSHECNFAQKKKAGAGGKGAAQQKGSQQRLQAANARRGVAVCLYAFEKHETRRVLMFFYIYIYVYMFEHQKPSKHSAQTPAMSKAKRGAGGNAKNVATAHTATQAQQIARYDRVR